MVCVGVRHGFAITSLRRSQRGDIGGGGRRDEGLLVNATICIGHTYAASRYLRRERRARFLSNDRPAIKSLLIVINSTAVAGYQCLAQLVSSLISYCITSGVIELSNLACAPVKRFVTPVVRQKRER